MIFLVDGTYSVMIKTPMGTQRGRLVLKSHEASLSGELYAMNGRYPFSGGTVHGEECSFATDLNTPFGRLHLAVKGRVEGNALHCSAATPFGPITATGTRAQK